MTEFYFDIMLVSFCPPGRLLDATHQYMYIFLLAGCEVTLSAFVLTLGNFLCIRKKRNEVNNPSSTKEEGLSLEKERNEDDKEEPKGQQNGQAGEVIMLKELGNEDTQL